MKRILLALFLFCCTGIASAIVTLQLEAPQVQMGENFTLNLRIEGTQFNLVPELTPLQKDFTIVGTQSNISYSIINGKVHAVSEWTITLNPKRSGALLIPPLQIGKEKTNPINIEIIQNPSTSTPAKMPGVKQQQQDVMLLAEADVINPYVNQQVIYTVKLLNSSRLLDANYSPPQVEDALFIPFGDGRRYQVTLNNKLYAVEEQQFALFPQKKGDLKIKPPVFNALVYDLDGPRRVSVQAEPTTLRVQPIPSPFKGKNWLPAKKVTLSESYDKNTAHLTQGTILGRTITLQAVGVPAQLLPTFNFGSSNQYNIYPEKPTVSNRFNQQDLIGTSRVRVSYLLNKSGKITIPSLSLPWFNTVTGKEELSSLPEFTINVIAAGNTPSTTAQVSPNSTQAIPATQTTVASTQAPSATTQASSSAINQAAEKTRQNSNLAWGVAAVFAVAWLLTIAAWRWQRSKQVITKHNNGQLKQLKEACLKNNPRQARDALLRWAHIQWPNTNLLNLMDLENLVDDPALKQQIKQLYQILYHDTKTQEWRGESLWQAVSHFQPLRKKDETNTLPPINRL